MQSRGRQDVEIPLPRMVEFLDFLHEQTGMEPVWLCPLAQRDPDVTWDLYPLDPAVTYVNVGFWGGVDLPEGGFDYDDFVRREFGSSPKPAGIPTIWWITALLLIVVSIALYFFAAR